MFYEGGIDSLSIIMSIQIPIRKEWVVQPSQV